MEPQAAPCDVFLSYHWRDHDAVERLARALDTRGLSVFLDRWTLTPGLPWPQALEQALKQCRAVVVCVGPEGMGPWQMREQFLALDRQNREARRSVAFPVIPVLLPGAGADPPLGFLKLNTWIDLRARMDDALALEALARAARGLPTGPEQGAKARAAVCPYRGLQAFREEDAPFFFGREAFTETLVEAVRHKSFIAVVGASGSGKSSVVRAGLVPRLRRAKGGDDPVWDIVRLTPDAQPLDSLAEAILRILEPEEMSEAKRLAELDDLATQFATRPRSLQRAARRCLEKQSGTDHLLLVVDQWEELYTLCRDEEARRWFIDQVLTASADSPVTVVLTLRGDFYGRVLTHRGLVDRLQHAEVKLGPMTREELRSTLEGPASEVGLEFEPGLVDHILDDVGKEPGNLPLLEYMLKELWDARRHGRVLHFEAYERMKGVRGAIEARAERIFEKELTDEQKEAARRVLMRLVRPGEGAPDTRRRAVLPTADEDALAVVHKLADARLLVTGRDEARTDAQTVEIAHEALIQHWDRLRHWVDEDREFLRTRERIETAAALWDKEDRVDDRLLVPGRPLAEAEDLLEKRRPDLSPSLVAFIEASTAAEARRQEALQEERQEAHRQKLRRNRLIAVASVLVALVMTGLGLFALDRWTAADKATRDAETRKEEADRERNKAVSRALATQASLLVERGPSEDALLRAGALSIESWRRTPNADAYSVAMNLLQWFPVRRIEADPESRYSPRILFSPDNRLLVIASPPSIRLVESASGKETMRIEESGIPLFYFSSDSRFLFLVGHDRERVIHVESAKEVYSVSEGKFTFHRTLDKRGGPRCLTTMSPDGRWLALTSAETAGRTDGITVVDMTTGKEAFRIAHQPESTEAPLGLNFSRLGTSLIIMDYRAGTLRLIDVPGGRERTLFTVGGEAISSYLLENGRYLVVEALYNSEQTFHFIDPETGKELGSIHFSKEHKAELSADGRRMVSKDDKEARLLEVPTGKELARWQESSLKASYDISGQRLILQSESGLVHLIDSASGMEISRTELGCEADDWGIAEFRSEDDSLVLLCHNKGEVHTVTASTGKETARFTVDGWWKLFSPGARFTVTQDKDLEVVRLHEIKTGQEFGRFATHGFRISAHVGLVSFPGQLTFSPDGRYLAIPSPAGSVRLADLSSAYNRLRVEAVCKASKVLSRDHRLLAFAGPDHVVRVIDMTTGREVGTLRHDGPAFPVHISSDGQFLTTEQKPILKINEIETGREVARLQRNSNYSIDFQTSPDGRYLAIHNYKGSSGGLVSSSSLEEILQYPHDERCGNPVFSPNGSWFAMANRVQHYVQMFDTASGRERLRIAPDAPTRPGTGPCCPKFSPDGESLAVDASGTVQLYDISTKTDKPRLKHQYSTYYASGAAQEPSFSPDGRTLAIEVYQGQSGEGLTVLFFDVETERELFRLESGSRSSGSGTTERLFEFKFAFSPDRHFFAVGAAAGDPVRLFDAKTGTELAHMELGWGFKGVLFSPDGRTLAAASNNGSVRLLDVESRRVLGTGQHAKAVTHMEFSPDNRFLVISSQDGTALMMETESGTAMARFDHGAPLTQANFSHDGQSLLTVSDDKVKLWPADPEWPFKQLCERSGRNLSPEEWRTFIGESEAWTATCPNWHTEKAPGP